MKTPGGWRLEVLRRRRDSWATEQVPVTQTLKPRTFEPVTPGMNVLGSENRRFKIADLSVLSPLIEPRDLLGPMFPRAPITGRHAIYVAETNAGRLYFPALLLMQHLWLWSDAALRAILTPNSLDVFLGAARANRSGIEVAADPQLTSRTPTDAALQRIAWLVESSEARASWNSVLTNAYKNRIDILLPPVSMSGWAWGVELSSGYLACELLSLRIKIELTEPLPQFRIGNVLHKCPRTSSPPPARSVTSLDINSGIARTPTDDNRIPRYFT
ncbi:MAG: hypothetical protein ACYCST_02345 [Acidimicrobiales bacterium]